VSTRRVDQLVESLGLRISKSEVSRIAALLDEQVQAFRERPLEGRYPDLFVDAKVEKVRDGGRVASMCVVIAHVVHETGRREIIGLDVGAAETRRSGASSSARSSRAALSACTGRQRRIRA
jgi:transposase-like protein